MEKKSINARIKELRTSKRYKQSEFGELIGLKQVAVSNMEKDGNTVTEQNIQMICQKFHVRRAWLVDGEGEMYDSPENSLFSSFAKEFSLSQAEQNAARFFLSLPAEERKQVLKYVTALADAIKGSSQPQMESQPQGKEAIDAEVSAYREELEGAQGKQSPFAGGEGTTKRA